MKNLADPEKIALTELEKELNFRFTETLWAPECILSERQETLAARKNLEISPDHEAFMLVNMGEFGYGLFARKNIPANTPLFIYAGEYSSQRLGTTYQVDIADGAIFGCRTDIDCDPFDPMFPYIDFQIHGVIDGKYFRNFGAFVQHLPSKYDLGEYYPKLPDSIKAQVATPNIEISKERIYVGGLECRVLQTITDIKAGSIIGYSYGLTYWKDKQKPALFDSTGKYLDPLATCSLATSRYSSFSNNPAGIEGFNNTIEKKESNPSYKLA